MPCRPAPPPTIPSLFPLPRSLPPPIAPPSRPCLDSIGQFILCHLRPMGQAPQAPLEGHHPPRGEAPQLGWNAGCNCTLPSCRQAFLGRFRYMCACEGWKFAMRARRAKACATENKTYPFIIMYDVSQLHLLPLTDPPSPLASLPLSQSLDNPCSVFSSISSTHVSVR